jgi:hypothetical protein
MIGYMTTSKGKYLNNLISKTSGYKNDIYIYIYIYISPTINSYNKTQMENENLISEAYIHG